MGRSIKFRAWDFTHSKMIYPTLENGITVINNLNTNIVIITNYDGEKWSNYPLPNAEEMQFTGLLDKNGKEIYEGDIVNFGNYSDNKKPCNFSIIYNEEDAGFGMIEIRNFGSNVFVSGMDNKVCEVIGNIHENPELLSK